VRRPAVFPVMTPILSWLFLSTCSPAICGERPAGLPPDTGVDFVLRKVKEKEDRLKTLEALFFQEKQSSLLKEPLKSEGTLFFDHAGRRMLVRVEKPRPFKVLLEKGRVVTSDPTSLETEEYYLGSGDVLGAYLGLGRSPEELKMQYDISLRNTGSEDTIALRLIPKGRRLKRRIRVIDADVDRRTWLPVLIRYDDARGGSTKIRLKIVSENQPLPEGVFEIGWGAQESW